MKVKEWTPKCTAISALTHKFNFTLSFNKEADNCWYVDIPYPLDHANLQMVAGADRFLTALARGSRRVTVQFCDHDFDGCEHEWHAIPERESYGCTYNVTSPIYSDTAWLCPVTLYVLGHFPKHIYIRQIPTTTPTTTTTTNATNKKVIVISENRGDGKTSLIEALACQKLIWTPMEIDNKPAASSTTVNHQGNIIEIIELNDIISKDPSLHPTVAKMMIEADAIIEVHDISQYITLSHINQIYDIKIDDNNVESIIKDKLFLALTKGDQENASITWWNSLSVEAREAYNQNNKIHGNPKFNTYIEGQLNDMNLCLALYALNYDNEKVFFPTKDDNEEIDNMRASITKLLYAPATT